MNTNYICTTCGIQFAATDSPPANCPICRDERQYVNRKGQSWTTLADLRKDHHNYFKTEEPGLIAIATHPGVAIGQRALLLQTPHGNVLWDCTPLLDEITIKTVEALGGISAIAVSHPHLSSTLVDWSHAFDNAPIYWHVADKEWVMRPDPNFVFWEGRTVQPIEGITLINCGGHFPGSSVLYWAAGAESRGVLLTGDTITVVADNRYVTFMYSYPNQIPLSGAAVGQIVNAIEPFNYDRIYGGWFDSVIPEGAKKAVNRSAQRYLQFISGE